MMQKTVLAILCCYLLLLILMFVFQRHLQYHPLGQVGKISDYALDGFSEQILTTTDGKKILTWYKPAPENAKLIIYFHGNAGNISDRAHKFAAFAKAGFGVLAISYHGYAGSEGSPSEGGLIMDSEAALKFALDQNYMMHNLIYFGESLGSGVAIQLAARFDPFAVVLESPYSSIASVAQKTYWFVPVKLLLKDKFDSISFVKKIASPVIIFHGTNDKIVPYSEGEKLFEEISARKKLITVPNAGHLDFSDQFLIDEMNKFFSK